MITESQLRELTDLSGPERAFLSVYLSRPAAWDDLEREVQRVRALLADNADEAEHFAENLKLVTRVLADAPPDAGPFAVFVCWALDFTQALDLPVPVGDALHVDSSPYVLPVAEILDEFEAHAVVAVDNERARIHVVAIGKTGDETTVRGNIKNHVRKGGWSQQRYERRRDKQIHHYAKDIVARLIEIERDEPFERLILVGSREAIAAVGAALPAHLARKVVGEKAVDLGKGDAHVDGEVYELFVAAERASEKALWDRIRDLSLSGGLASLGPEAVLADLQTGRVDHLLLNREVELVGVRCRDADHLSAGAPSSCPVCGSTSLFAVDLANELVELATQTGAAVEIAEPLPKLAELGGVAALRRY